MDVEELLKELQTDDKLYKLTLLYLLVKKEEKTYLLELYKKGNDSDVCASIKNAIHEDKETMKILEILSMDRVWEMEKYHHLKKLVRL